MSKKGVSLGLVKALVSKATGADPAVIEQAVSDWLDAHPEATTTVQDGSITEQKLATSIAQKLGLISSLSDEIDTLGNKINLNFVNGTFATSDGAIQSSTTRIRSNPFYATRGFLKTESGYDFIIGFYDVDTHAWSNATSWIQEYAIDSPCVAMIQIRKTSNANIAPEESTNLAYQIIDETYTEEFNHGGFYCKSGLNKLPDTGYTYSSVVDSTGISDSTVYDVSPFIKCLPRSTIRARRFENDTYSDYATMAIEFLNAAGERIIMGTSYPAIAPKGTFSFRTNIKKTGKTVITINEALPETYVKYVPETTTKQALDNLNATAFNHWNGKNWYAYGTSLTSVHQETGKYPTYLSQFSGLVLTEKGIGGGGICNNSLIKNAVMNVTDGKLEADLITLEVGANDTTATLGTIYDTGNDTFCGALNQCIRYLQENTTAQIVVISSTNARTNNNNSSAAPEVTYGSDNHTKFDQWEATRKVCEINSCYYIPMGETANMSYARMNANNLYNVDNIHHTDLGGYNLAKYVWNVLKNIPLWYTEIPSDT